MEREVADVVLSLRDAVGRFLEAREVFLVAVYFALAGLYLERGNSRRPGSESVSLAGLLSCVGMQIVGICLAIL